MFRKCLYVLRRKLLQLCVPEFIWPKFVVLSGASIPLRGMPYSFGIKSILCKGNYELPERTLVVEILKPGDHVLEMGGSIGVLAAVVKAAVGSSGRVISIEANEALTTTSRSWLEPLGNVQVVNGIGFPVWDVPVKFKTSVTFESDGNSLGGHVVHSDSGTGSHSKLQIYDIHRIESEFGFKPSVLLLDIEGSEIALLEPGVSLPSNVQSIIMELHPWMYGDGTVSKILIKLKELGFEEDNRLGHTVRLHRTRMAS